MSNPMQEFVLAASNRGPWRVFLDEGFGEFVIAERKTRYGYDGVAVEFSVYGDSNGDEGVPSPVEWERARLIAAAPEMAEALLGCVEHMEHSTPQGRAAWGTATALLARIRGDAP